jgi:predicted transcriptional regulator
LIDDYDEQSLSLSTNDDLKELCILLDEERCKMHQLAEQWKHFGTSTIHKLECQIVDYQDKLSELEQRQHILVNENTSLKSLVERMQTTTIDDSHNTNREWHDEVHTHTHTHKMRDRCVHRFVF